MPPNRKGSPDLAQGLANLNVASFVATSKYAPLTSSAKTAAAPTVVDSTTTTKPAPAVVESASYWVWKSPKDHEAAAFEETAASDLFSVHHIERNLILAAAANLAESATLKAVDTDTHNSNYWFMPCDGQASVAVVEEVVTPVVVKKQGPLSHLVSAQHVQDNLQQHTVVVVAPTTDHPHASSNDTSNYWQWSTFPERELSKVASAEQERIQPMFACSHLQEQLVDQYGCGVGDKAVATTLQEPSPMIATNDSYWVF